MTARALQRIRSLAASAGRSLRSAVARARLLLAAKTAVAVGLAWAIAPHLPGVVDDLPFYAPLGALVSMYPTLMGSVKTGAQTILGLAAGIALASVFVVTTGANWWTLPVVAGIAVLLSGTGWFAAGREYVAIAALLVLMIGGRDPEAYSLSYLVQMGLGVAIGLAVNLAISPRPFTGAARERMSALRDELAGHLSDLAEALSDESIDVAEWERNADSLAETARDVGRSVAEADESVRFNPRAHGRSGGVDHDEWAALHMMLFHVQDISGTLTDALGDRPWAFAVDPELVPVLREACDAVAEVIRAPDPSTDEAREAHDRAERAVRLLIDETNRMARERGNAVGPASHVAMHLNRILRRVPDDE